VKWRTHDEAGHSMSRFVMGPDISLQPGLVEHSCRATFDQVIHLIERSTPTLRERTSLIGLDVLITSRHNSSLNSWVNRLRNAVML